MQLFDAVVKVASVNGKRFFEKNQKCFPFGSLLTDVNMTIYCPKD